MTFDQAVVTSRLFLEDYIASQMGFSRTGDPDDFRLRFVEVRKGGHDTLVAVFALQSAEDTQAPDPEILALAQRCTDAMVDAWPGILQYIIEFEFVH